MTAIMAALLALYGCGESAKLPNDPELERFIDTAARCGYLERAYAHDQELLSGEIEGMSFPKDWDALVDSLISTYGTDPEFWYQVYSEIQERSRESSVTEDP